MVTPNIFCKKLMNIQLIKSKDIYSGKVFRVKQDHYMLPNGNIGKFDIVQHQGAVVILPFDNEGLIWFVKQYRYAIGEVLLELPAGTIENDESPEASCKREIREEIGMAAGNIKKLGEFYIAPGYSTEYLYIYLAENLKPDPLPGDIDELITIEKLTIDIAFKYAESGKIRDAKTLATLLLAHPFLIK